MVQDVEDDVRVELREVAEVEAERPADDRTVTRSCDSTSSAVLTLSRVTRILTGRIEKRRSALRTVRSGKRVASLIAAVA